MLVVFQSGILCLLHLSATLVVDMCHIFPTFSCNVSFSTILVANHFSISDISVVGGWILLLSWILIVVMVRPSWIGVTHLFTVAILCLEVRSAVIHGPARVSASVWWALVSWITRLYFLFFLMDCSCFGKNCFLYSGWRFYHDLILCYFVCPGIGLLNLVALSDVHLIVVFFARTGQRLLWLVR